MISGVLALYLRFVKLLLNSCRLLKLITFAPHLLVGHVTKEGELAEPCMLEHMGDTVPISFEGERHHTFRILRAVKTVLVQLMRLGFLRMQSGGLVEVLNPSQVSLEERLDGAYQVLPLL